MTWTCATDLGLGCHLDKDQVYQQTEKLLTKLKLHSSSPYQTETQQQKQIPQHQPIQEPTPPPAQQQQEQTQLQQEQQQEQQQQQQQPAVQQQPIANQKTPIPWMNIGVYACFLSVCVSVIYHVGQFPNMEGLLLEACGDVRFSWLLPGWAGGRGGDTANVIVDLWKCSMLLYQDRFAELFALYFTVYISLKTLAIPGAMVLCVLAGATLPLMQAQLLVTLCEVVGGTSCYVLSKSIGGPLIQHMWPSLLHKFQSSIEENRDNLFYYTLFLRVTPLVPNNAMNALASVVGIPYWMFLLTTVLGVQPTVFLRLTTGQILRNFGEASFELKKADALFNVAILFVVQFVALVPVLLKKKGYIGGKKTIVEKQTE